MASRTPSLKPALKRGALIAAANWQVTLIQSAADALFKLLLVVPVIGGVFLVALVVGTEPAGLMALEWREIVTTTIATLFAMPAVLTAFLLALAVVIVGGSTFMFLVKGGTVTTLVAGDTHGGLIEQPPLHLSSLARASQFSAERFIEGSSSLFPRYARLGFALMGVYLVSASAYLALIVASRTTGDGWSIAALATAAFVAWITGVNFIYLLLQIVVAADACSVATAARRVAAFLRSEIRSVAAVFGVVLVLVVCATAASLLATAALGLISFVPFLGLAVLPLQLAAWLLRGIVFQYLGLTAVGAYLKLYRGFAATTAARPARADRVIETIPLPS
jgi:hypothetical protein